MVSRATPWVIDNYKHRQQVLDRIWLQYNGSRLSHNKKYVYQRKLQICWKRRQGQWRSGGFMVYNCCLCSQLRRRKLCCGLTCFFLFLLNTFVLVNSLIYFRSRTDIQTQNKKCIILHNKIIQYQNKEIEIHRASKSWRREDARLHNFFENPRQICIF